MIQRFSTLDISVFDPNRCVVNQLRYPLRSFVNNWIRLNFHGMAISGISVTSTTGGSFALPNFNVLRTDVVKGQSEYGVVIGTGTTAVGISDTKLETQIAHGTSGGRFVYEASMYDEPEISGSSCFFRSRRQFLNQSGGTIFVSECGIYTVGGGTSVTRVCVVRDVFSPVGIPDNFGMEAMYTMQVTV